MLSLEDQNIYRERYRQQHPGWRPATEVYAAAVRAALQPDSRILDTGCGRGGLLEQLDHLPAQAVGLDPDWASLVEHRIPTLPRTAGWSDALPFAPASFDVVCASWVLEHLENPQETFAAAARVLRPGGRFIFITPNGRHPLAWANRLLGGLGRLQGRLVERLYGRAAADTFPTYYRANDHRRLQALTATCGLKLTALHAVPDPTYLAFSGWMYQLACRLEKRLPAGRHIHLVGVAAKPEADGAIYPISFGVEV